MNSAFAGDAGRHGSSGAMTGARSGPWRTREPRQVGQCAVPRQNPVLLRNVDVFGKSGSLAGLHDSTSLGDADSDFLRPLRMVSPSGILGASLPT